MTFKPEKADAANAAWVSRFTARFWPELAPWAWEEFHEHGRRGFFCVPLDEKRDRALFCTNKRINYALVEQYDVTRQVLVVPCEGLVERFGVPSWDRGGFLVLEGSPTPPELWRSRATKQEKNEC
jgi:hypothetical protein